MYHLGERPYEQLPDYSRGFNAALVPFRMSELTVSVNPIKLREYAAAGLPIVSSPLPEIRRCGTLSAIATSDLEWIDAVRAAVELGEDADFRHRQSERVRSDDWSSVCARISALVNGTRQ